MGILLPGKMVIIQAMPDAIFILGFQGSKLGQIMCPTAFWLDLGVKAERVYCVLVLNVKLQQCFV